MSASRRLYADIACCTYAYVEGMPEETHPVIRSVMTLMAGCFQRDNPNFDREQFMKECGLRQIRG